VIPALIAFAIGLCVGIIASIAAAIAILNRPPPERERPIYSVNGGRSTKTTGPQDVFTSVNSKLL
jgi:hypothetical protein